MVKLLRPRLAKVIAVVIARMTQSSGGLAVDGDAVIAICIRIASIPTRPHCSRYWRSLNTPLPLPFVSPCNGKDLICVVIESDKIQTP